jgi:hypothetical protein
MTDELIFTKPEPTKFRQDILKRFNHEWETDEHIRWRVEKEHYDRFNSVPKEIRQKALDYWKSSGKTVGEVAEQFKIDSQAMGDIIFLNISQALYLREETL